MKKVFSILSAIFIIMGFSLIYSISTGWGVHDLLTFGTTGPVSLLFFNIYNFLGLVFAFIGEKNKFRDILIACSSMLLVYTLIFTFIGIYGFREA
ncbi:hypothetical protein H0266_14220 [Halobacillus locisalis]|uniref:Uncharacterized protein n=1 Tax=Halobacillus locisalis TaxID=220753 RepID=A0A838CW37_9BACI|nr:hypothetical protein [Halobacillus locisalis]MBA2176049.1 hypothetical protein [Halobacillus locisalis]